jgi:hypothetical protein
MDLDQERQAVVEQMPNMDSPLYGNHFENRMEFGNSPNAYWMFNKFAGIRDGYAQQVNSGMSRKVMLHCG